MDEIGKKLREARIEKGYTLDDLQKITKIQKRYLIAIEDGRFDALPGDFYVRAFIKQYADTVGLNSEDLLSEFNDTIPNTQPHEYVEKATEAQTRTTKQSSDSKLKNIRNYAPLIIIIVVALVILFGIYYVASQRANTNRQIISDSSSIQVKNEDNSGSSSKAKGSSSSKQSESSSSASSSSKNKDDKLSVTLGANSGGVETFTIKNMPSTKNTLTLSADNATAWMAITIGGSQVWQGTLQAGSSQSQEIPAGTTSFMIRTGNGPATKVKINDTDVNISPNNETDIVRTITMNIEQ